jgi:hypothetical protein
MEFLLNLVEHRQDKSQMEQKFLVSSGLRSRLSAPFEEVLWVDPVHCDPAETK